MKKITTTLLITLAASYASQAKASGVSYGIEYGATFNYKATFKSGGGVMPGAANPGNATGNADRTYDDGYNYQSSLTELTGATSLYRYDDASQYDAANDTLTFNSALTTFDGAEHTGSQTEAQHAIRAFWQKKFSQNERFNYGMRVAVGFQNVSLDSAALYAAQTVITTDVYSAEPGTVLLPPDTDGSYTPGGTSLIPNEPFSRSFSEGESVAYRQMFDFDVDMYTADFGPIITWELCDRVALEGFIGASVAVADGEFCYRDTWGNQGSDSETDLLFGGVVRGDVKIKLTDRWGLLFGASYTQLQDFEQSADNHAAALEFGDSYSLNFGFFFE